MRMSLKSALRCHKRQCGEAPAWRGRALSLRVYAIAGPDGYQVIPGGMARIASDVYADVVSTQRGGGSKDVWVLGRDDESSQAAELAPRSRLAQ